MSPDAATTVCSPTVVMRVRFLNRASEPYEPVRQRIRGSAVLPWTRGSLHKVQMNSKVRVHASECVGALCMRYLA